MSNLPKPLGLNSLGLDNVRLDGGLGNGGLLLGLKDGDGVGQRLGDTGLLGGGGVSHNLDLDTEDTLSQQNVTGGSVNEVSDGLTGVDHETVGELHGLGSGGSQLSGDNNLDTLGAGVHNVSDNTVGGSSDGQTVEQLVLDGLALGDGRQTSLLDSLSVDGDGALGESESLLDKRHELSDSSAVLTEHLVGVGGSDNNLGLGGGESDLDTGVSLLGELSGEELVELGVEDTVGDDLSLLGDGDSGGHFDVVESVPLKIWMYRSWEV